jgi:hypothetical protein
VHYDLIKDGWIRHKEFHHAMADVYGFAFRTDKDDAAENLENLENPENRRTVGSVCESLYPLLDPEGRGHCEYQILVDYIQAHVDSRTSSSHHHLARLQQSLQATIQANTRLEQVSLVHVGGTRCGTSSTGNNMKRHVRITLKVEFIQCIFLFFDVKLQL